MKTVYLCDPEGIGGCLRRIDRADIIFVCNPRLESGRRVPMISAGPVQSDAELAQILALQRANLTVNLTRDEAAAQGFVTLEHTLELLQQMHRLAPSIVARDEARRELAGYALVMPVECRPLIPVLEPMFQRLDALGFSTRSYYVMGQICVAPQWRGRGVFDLLYQTHREVLGRSFESCVTEVAMRNGRSLRAHQRIGFEIIERYQDATDDWALLEWKLGAAPGGPR